VKFDTADKKIFRRKSNSIANRTEISGILVKFDTADRGFWEKIKFDCQSDKYQGFFVKLDTADKCFWEKIKFDCQSDRKIRDFREI
jgi:hypothetical protein